MKLQTGQAQADITLSRDEKLRRLEKAEARKKARLNRKKIYQDDVARGGLTSDLVCERLMIEIQPTITDIISLTLSIGDELDVTPIIIRLNEENVPLVLPRVNSIDVALTFHEYKLGDPLEFEPFGTRTPQNGAKQMMPNIVIVPFLAFNDKGYRLGYGGGFYDRTLAHFDEIGHQYVSVGIGFDAQYDAEFPVEPHDKPLNYILTERNFYCYNQDEQIDNDEDQALANPDANVSN